MKLTLQNIKKLKQETNSFLTKKVCNYVINKWSDYSNKTDIFTDVLYHTAIHHVKINQYCKS